MLFDRVKPLDAIMATAEKKGLHRSLGPFQLTMLGIGAVIGTGIFVLTAEAAQKAGPGMLASFMVAGFVCAVAALCYSELASMVPVAGSAYTYTYAVVGELMAWMVGWALILEYAVGASAVAVGWSNHAIGLLHGLGVDFPAAIGNADALMAKVELLFGAAPTPDIQAALATGDVPVPDTADLGTRRPDLPAPMVKAVRRGLSAVPEGRFDTIAAFTQALFAAPRPWARMLYAAASVIVLALMAGLVAVVQVFHQGGDPRFVRAPQQRWGSAANRSHVAPPGATEVKTPARVGKRRSGSVLAAPLVGPASAPDVPKGALAAARPAPRPKVTSDGRSAMVRPLAPVAGPIKGFDPKTSRELPAKRRERSRTGTWAPARRSRSRDSRSAGPMPAITRSCSPPGSRRMYP